MAAYASLVSLMYIIEKIQDHPLPPISLDESQVESLTEKVTFLQDFLEVYNYRVRDYGLESRIVDVASAGENVLESNIVDRILSDQSNSSNELFYQDLQRVIKDMDLIKREVMEIKGKMGSVQEYHLGQSSVPVFEAGSSSSTMVGFDDVLIQLLDKLTGQPSSDCQIIPIVGMGGMGKTTLARNVYKHSLIVHHFDIRFWATVSQEYNARELIIQLLSSQGNNNATLSEMNEGELGERLHKTLWGRRYLIIMDDVWSIDAWDKVKLYFPNNNNGSGIIITSRHTNLALHLTGGYVFEMKFLNEGLSWNLLRETIFGESDCPSELEATGKKIARDCKGLPLSLVVIGGLLAKSNRTQEYWEYIAENIKTIVSLENNAQCLDLLYLSYNHLPVHLKPCFLYVGIFREDHEIKPSELIQLWVDEGFVKPSSGKSLEEVAEQYLMELVYRNLVLKYAERNYFNGNFVICKIHDLLRELCIREAEKEKFFFVIKNGSPKSLKNQRLISFSQNPSEDKEFLHGFQYASNVHSLITDSEKGLSLKRFRLLRMLRGFYSKGSIDHLVNLRSFVATNSSLTNKLYHFWNLHTLVLHCRISVLDIFKMPHLRSVEGSDRGFHLGKEGTFVLKYLHKLTTVADLRCTEEMVKRIPNIKTLHIVYRPRRITESHYCPANFVCFQKLEELRCSFNKTYKLLNDFTFPHSLKKLRLYGGRLESEQILAKIGSLPFLQELVLSGISFLEELVLDSVSFTGREWETVEGYFCSLEYLRIAFADLECWMTENTHFPCLKKLVLNDLPNLKEIPLSIGDIPTLELIEIIGCQNDVYISAKTILEEQDELGNDILQVVAYESSKQDQKVLLESLASHNFIVRNWEFVYN